MTNDTIARHYAHETYYKYAIRTIYGLYTFHRSRTPITRNKLYRKPGVHRKRNVLSALTLSLSLFVRVKGDKTMKRETLDCGYKGLRVIVFEAGLHGRGMEEELDRVCCCSMLTLYFC